MEYIIRSRWIAVLLIALMDAGCTKKADPNRIFYRSMGIPDGEKPYLFEKRRVNVDTSPMLETVLVFKKHQDSPWKLYIMKQSIDMKTYDKAFDITVAPDGYLLDRTYIKDLFKDSYNSIFLEFSRLDTERKKVEKLIRLYRYPYSPEALFHKDFAMPADWISESGNDQKRKKYIRNPYFRWEDASEDGRYEFLIRKDIDPTTFSNEKDHLEYAYSKMNVYKEYHIYKFNGFSMVPYSPAKPFFFYKSVTVPKQIEPGEKEECVFRISNLGAYSSKVYVTFSFSPEAQIEVHSLKTFSRIYRSGSRVFHIPSRSYINARYPMLEYTMFPWPSARTYTFRFSLTTRRRLKSNNLMIYSRQAAEYQGKTLYFPAHEPGLPKDQQGMPSYINKVRFTTKGPVKSK